MIAREPKNNLIAHRKTKQVFLTGCSPIASIKNDLPNWEEDSYSNQLYKQFELAISGVSKSVGKLSFTTFPFVKAEGSGVVIAKGVIVTNRHIFESGEGEKAKFLLSKGLLSCYQSIYIDFCYENEAVKPSKFKVIDFDDHFEGKYDIIFLKLEDKEGIPPPLPLVSQTNCQPVFHIGHPFGKKEDGDVWPGKPGTKIISVGDITYSDPDEKKIYHNCNAESGSSGGSLSPLSKVAQICGIHTEGGNRLQPGNDNGAIDVGILDGLIVFGQLILVKNIQPIITLSVPNIQDLIFEDYKSENRELFYKRLSYEIYENYEENKKSKITPAQQAE